MRRYYRNLKNGVYLGTPRKFDSNVASMLANNLRQRGYLTRVIPSKGGNRLYINPNRYLKKKTLKERMGELNRMDVRFPEFRSQPRPGGIMAVNDSRSNQSNINRVAFKRFKDYFDWKNFSYRHLPLRWVAIGFVDGTKNQSYDPDKQVGLLGVGLMPSNIAKQHLLALGFDVANDKKFNEWYEEDRDILGELWHAQNENVYLQAQDINFDYRESFDAGRLNEQLMRRGQRLVYSISDDLEVEDEFIRNENVNTVDKNYMLQKDSLPLSGPRAENESWRSLDLLASDLTSPLGPAFDSEASDLMFRAGMTTEQNPFLEYDLEERARFFRRWLPQIHQYVSEAELNRFIDTAFQKTRPENNAFVRYPQTSVIGSADFSRNLETYDPQTTSDMSELFSEEFYPSGTEPYLLFEKNPTLREETALMLSNSMSFDFMNLQGIQWDRAPTLMKMRPDKNILGVESVVAEQMEPFEYGMDIVPFTGETIAELLPHGYLNDSFELNGWKPGQELDPEQKREMDDTSEGLRALTESFQNIYYDGEPTETAEWNRIDGKPLSIERRLSIWDSG